LNAREFIDNRGDDSSIFEDGDASQKEYKTANVVLVDELLRDAISPNNNESKEVHARASDFINIKSGEYEPN